LPFQSPLVVWDHPTVTAAAGPDAGLVTPACLALLLSPGLSGTAFVAVDLAAIVAATDEHLCTARATQKEAARLSVLECWREET
jgi:hypothetical protein